MRIDACVMAAALFMLPHTARRRVRCATGRRRTIGAREALAEFTPSIKLDNALPLGAKGQLQPTDTTFNSTSAVGQFTEGLLSGLDFWRANIGVAVRW